MKLVFTSCMDAQRVPRQPIWDAIREVEPDVLLLLGDQIYMDWNDLGVSNWKRLIDIHGDRQFERYIAEMHSRYAAQAEVHEFQCLLMHMAVRGKPVVMCWDDHDFAWNNAVCVEPGPDVTGKARQDWDRHGVSDRIRAASLSLFLQFKDFVANPGMLYPPMHEAFSMPQYEGITDPALLLPTTLDCDGVPVEFMLLDTRWFRSPRKMNGSTILGCAQREKLIAAVSQPRGLLIVAAGSPIKHKYLLGEQDWTGGSGDEYPEFAELLNSAKRPVLYLAGDIHRNAWGGRVRRAAQQSSEVIQILSSGAAIDDIGPKEFKASYGYLEILSRNSGGGTVNCQLRQQQVDRHGDFGPDPTEPAAGRVFSFNADRWLEVALDGEASDDATWLSRDHICDTDSLAVLMCIERIGAKQYTNPLTAGLDCLYEIDEAYKENTNATGGIPSYGFPVMPLPEPLRVRVNSADCTLSLTLQTNGNDTRRRSDTVRVVIEEAFKAARRRGAPAVFYVHGLGKTPSGAIDQGYGLRAIYGCEPIVFGWPAGTPEGGLSSYFAPFDAKRGASDAVYALRDSIRIFGEYASAYKDLVTVILARSTGATLLHLALGGGASNEFLRDVNRIVLSSPGIEVGDFRRLHGNAFAMPYIPKTFVTVNRHDATLKRSKWVSPLGPALGIEDPIGDCAMPKITYFEYLGIGYLHDYLLLRLNDAQQTVNIALLTARAVDPYELRGTTPVADKFQVFTVA